MKGKEQLPRTTEVQIEGWPSNVHGKLGKVAQPIRYEFAIDKYNSSECLSGVYHYKTATVIVGRPNCFDAEQPKTLLRVYECRGPPSVIEEIVEELRACPSE